ncbi:uncharacterized protein LOC127240883 [Andrographis paniculata]|uniref:uncharacterized protein LOC127240883 n=1 Tax=Andrographis paniculata TaxID=175694 RepID=UPI0021E83EA8|nr:uncharacterized protein LOC127240883 [Andrographis paniculata]
MKITRQAKVLISIGLYKEDVLCDVTPMTACHVLLGQPWQSDKGIIYDGKTNKVRFYDKGYKVMIPSFPLKEVRKDQKSLRRKIQEAESLKRAKGKEVFKEEKIELTSKASNILLSLTDFQREVGDLDHQNGGCFMWLCKDLFHSDKDNLLTNFSISFARMLEEMKDLYPEELLEELPPIRGIEHQIDFIHRASIPNSHAYRCNPDENKEIQKQVQELLENGWVRNSLSQCVVPVIIVPNNDGILKMCVDFRLVNAITIKYRHPIPCLNGLLDEINGARIFSKIDIRSG